MPIFTAYFIFMGWLRLFKQPMGEIQPFRNLCPMSNFSKKCETFFSHYSKKEQALTTKNEYGLILRKKISFKGFRQKM